MRRKTYRIMAIMATALLAFATGGCVDPLDDSLKPQPEEPTLTFWIKVPGSMFATKAGTGNVSSFSPESKIFDVMVWAFPHGDANGDKPLNFIEKDNIGFEHETTDPRSWTDSYKIKMPLPKEFVLGNSPKVDLYILANWQSIFTSSNKPQNPEVMTRAAVRDLAFGVATSSPYFGTTSPTQGVPSTGLPISAIYKGENGNGVDIQFLQDAYNGKQNSALSDDVFRTKLGVIELERAVAKVRFVFARTTGLYGEITRIVIDENLIPDNIYAFKHETVTQTGTGDEAVTVTEIQLPGTSYGSTTTLPGIASASIMEVADPLVLRSDYVPANVAPTSSDYKNYPAGMDAQAYDTYLTNAIGEATATTELVYFRESDKMISGKIYFKKTAGGQEEGKPFVMTPVDKNDKYTNLYRNHYWTVYAYFLDGDLYVKPTVANWIDATEDPLAYTLKMNTNMRLFDSWLYRYDIDGDYTDYTKWATSHMAVSDGRVTEATETETVTGRPLRSPQIQLVTTGVKDNDDPSVGTFELRVDNKDFEIIRVNKTTTGAVESYEASTDVYKTINSEDVYQYGRLIIPAGEEVYTYFYIVPKTSTTNPPTSPTKLVAKVSLIYNDPVTGPQKVTFNYSALPGYSDDSSEIWAYYFPADEYNISGKLKMYYKDSNNPLVPTPVQN